MDIEQQRYILTALEMMLAIEELPQPDWQKVFELSNNTLKFIVTNDLGGDLDSYVIKFLDDADIRSKDASYGTFQRNKVRALLPSLSS